MADGTVLFAGAEAAVAAAFLAHLRADAGVQEIFGHPARIYDDETRGPAYPFARLERHETEPAGAAGVSGTEHTVTLTFFARHGGRQDAKAALSALRAAAETGEVVVAGQRVILVLATYGDVFRTDDRRAFRGLLRLRLITEAI